MASATFRQASCQSGATTRMRFVGSPQTLIEVVNATRPQSRPQAETTRLRERMLAAPIATIMITPSAPRPKSRIRSTAVSSTRIHCQTAAPDTSSGQSEIVERRSSMNDIHPAPQAPRRKAGQREDETLRCRGAISLTPRRQGDSDGKQKVCFLCERCQRQTQDRASVPVPQPEGHSGHSEPGRQRIRSQCDRGQQHSGTDRSEQHDRSGQSSLKSNISQRDRRKPGTGCQPENQTP